MKPWLKVTIGLLVSFIILLLVVVIGSYYMLNSTLPDYSGSLNVSEIKDRVKVYRDDYGIPYVYANSEEDLYFTLGFLHAQERLFQMDLTRRAGDGRLSEVLGEKTIPFDKMFKTIGLDKLVRKNFQEYSDQSKRILISYANGVNEFIDSQNSKFSIEFDILGYQPYKWEPEHSLLITKLMAWELNIGWWSDIALTHLIQKLGIEKVQDILPTFDENGPTIIPKELRNYASLPTNLIDVDREYRKFIGAVGTHIGSNNWVVSGKRSSSKKPIIANDPHLGFTAPGKWYVAVLRSPELSIDGFTLPGVPGVVIGKNESISWVLTNVMADDSDFYVEKLDSSKNNYFVDNTWTPLEIHTDTIFVKDADDVIFTIRKNHRGPIISDIHSYNEIYPNDQQKKADVSMRWSALEFSNELEAFYKINHAKNWEEFNNGVELFDSPGQNFVYADDKGNIGYVAGVKLPIRKNNSPSFIFDGTRTESDWIGYVQFSSNPRLSNPKQGFIASANNKTIEDYKYHISNVWEPKSRITRITELLKSKELHSVEDFRKYQVDFYSHYAKNLVPYIIGAFNDYYINNKNLKTALQILEQWDFVFDKSSQVPTVYSVFYNYLLKNIFEDEMGEELLKEYVTVANIPYRVVPKLLEENKSDWFDNVDTNEKEDRDFIIRKSLIDAMDYLENRIDKDITYWQWGELHTVLFKHFFHGASSFMDKLFDIGPFEIGGDGTTVFNTEYSLATPYLNKLGPSMRYIFDFNDPDKFELVLPTGQSGNFFSDHYDDMTEMWLNGDYITVNTHSDSVKKADYDLLELIPNK